MRRVPGKLNQRLDHRGEAVLPALQDQSAHGPEGADVRMYYQDTHTTLYHGDVLEVLKGFPTESVQTCVTSPPYLGLRNYKVDGQIGLERTPEEYVCKIVEVFREVQRVLRKDGTCWLNLGDSYNGYPGNVTRGGPLNGVNQHARASFPSGYGLLSPALKPKDLIGIPWRVAFALQTDGWWLRSDIVWSKPNPMPESVTDRPTKAHEYIFLLTKAERYFYDAEAIKEPVAISTIPRMYRGVSDSHKNVNGAPGQTPHSINQPRANGVGYGKHQDKQRGHSRRHAGFNDRWDLMTKDEQSALGRNKRDVWEVATMPYPEAHFATFPEELIKPCILAGSREGDTVLEPFAGSGTTLAVSKALGRRSIGIELNADYCKLAQKRIGAVTLPMPLEVRKAVSKVATPS